MIDTSGPAHHRQLLEGSESRTSRKPGAGVRSLGQADTFSCPTDLFKIFHEAKDSDLAKKSSSCQALLSAAEGTAKLSAHGRPWPDLSQNSAVPSQFRRLSSQGAQRLRRIPRIRSEGSSMARPLEPRTEPHCDAPAPAGVTR